MAIIKNELRNAFNRILEGHLDDIGTMEDLGGVYVIHENALKNITEALLKEVSIRVYIKGWYNVKKGCFSKS